MREHERNRESQQTWHVCTCTHAHKYIFEVKKFYHLVIATIMPYVSCYNLDQHLTTPSSWYVNNMPGGDICSRNLAFWYKRNKYVKYMGEKTSEVNVCTQEGKWQRGSKTNTKLLYIHISTTRPHQGNQKFMWTEACSTLWYDIKVLCWMACFCLMMIQKNTTDCSRIKLCWLCWLLMQKLNEIWKCCEDF